MLFIAKRSDSEDGAVPPEPVGPMEVAGREGRADWGHPQVMGRFNLHPVSGNIHRR